jgi:hypothetical protein
VPDPGPNNPARYLAAQIDEDDHAVDGIMIQVRKISDLRWEHSAPVRVGCRMGRPEKAAPRIMSPMTHALFPIDLTGGNQRLMAIAASKQTIRVQMGRRICSKCGKESPFVICHHRLLDEMERGFPEKTAEEEPLCETLKTASAGAVVKFNPSVWTRLLKTQGFDLASTESQEPSSA